MAEQAVHPALRVVLVAEEGAQRDRLRALLAQHGLVTACEVSLGTLSQCNLDASGLDVILIDLVEEPDVVSLERLIEDSPAPILFSESSMAVGHAWGDKLVRKLYALAGRQPEVSGTRSSVTSQETLARPALKVVSEDVTRPAADTTRLCVLGASIGGPEALKQFLAALPAELPIAFLLAQHIGPGFDHRLAAQLDRVTALDVRLAMHGDLPRTGAVLVVPTGGRLDLGSDGAVSITDDDWSGPYNPTINDVMVAAARQYGKQSCAILFSGMGNDGARGAVAIRDAGGYVWAQDEDSCVISSIPDSARRVGAVSFSGPPAVLAERLMTSCAQPAMDRA